MAVAGVIIGLVYPVTVVLLEEFGVEGWLIGIISAVGNVSVLLFASYTGVLIRKFNVRKMLIAGNLIVFAGVLLHVFWMNVIWLIPIRLLAGLGWIFIFVSTEVIINTSTEISNRKFYIALYGMFLSIGYAVGAWLMRIVEYGNWVPFVAGAVILVIPIIVQSTLVKDVDLGEETGGKKGIPILSLPPICLAAGILFGFWEVSIGVAVPLFGIRNGFTVDDVSYLMAAVFAGGILLVILMNYAFTSSDNRKMLLYISLGMAIICLLPGLVLEFSPLLIILLLIGTLGPAFYSISLNHLSVSVERKNLAQANGHYAMMYGMGAVMGPIIGAPLVDLNARYGYWVFLAGLFLIFFMAFKIYNPSK